MKKLIKAQQNFIEKLLELRDESMRLGLYKTMHKLTIAVNESGWELADLKMAELKGKVK